MLPAESNDFMWSQRHYYLILWHLYYYQNVATFIYGAAVSSLPLIQIVFFNVFLLQHAKSLILFSHLASAGKTGTPLWDAFGFWLSKTTLVYQMGKGKIRRRKRGGVFSFSLFAAQFPFLGCLVIFQRKPRKENRKETQTKSCLWRRLSHI